MIQKRYIFPRKKRIPFPVFFFIEKPSLEREIKNWLET